MKISAVLRHTRALPPPAHAAIALAWLAVVALQVVLGFSAAGGETAEPIYRYQLALNSTVFYALLIGLTVLLARPLGAAGETLALRRTGPRWFLAAGAVLLVAFAASAALEPLLQPGDEQGLTPEHWHPERLGQLAANVVVIALLGPLAEELFYRGLGIRLFGFLGAAVAGIAASLAWALAHGIVAALPALALFGVGLAWLRLRSRSLWPAVAAHTAYNTLVLAVALVLAPAAPAGLLFVNG